MAPLHHFIFGLEVFDVPDQRLPVMIHGGGELDTLQGDCGSHLGHLSNEFVIPLRNLLEDAL